MTASSKAMIAPADAPRDGSGGGPGSRVIPGTVVGPGDDGFFLQKWSRDCEGGRFVPATPAAKGGCSSRRRRANKAPGEGKHPPSVHEGISSAQERSGEGGAEGGRQRLLAEGRPSAEGAGKERTPGLPATVQGESVRDSDGRLPSLSSMSSAGMPQGEGGEESPAAERDGGACEEGAEGVVAAARSVESDWRDAELRRLRDELREIRTKLDGLDRDLALLGRTCPVAAGAGGADGGGGGGKSLFGGFHYAEAARCVRRELACLGLERGRWEAEKGWVEGRIRWAAALAGGGRGSEGASGGAAAESGDAVKAAGGAAGGAVAASTRPAPSASLAVLMSPQGLGEDDEAFVAKAIAEWRRQELDRLGGERDRIQTSLSNLKGDVALLRTAVRSIHYSDSARWMRQEQRWKEFDQQRLEAEAKWITDRMQQLNDAFRCKKSTAKPVC